MKLINKNKKAYFDYEIVQEYKTGMVLTGSEIKSIRAGNVNLAGSYVSLLGGEAFLKGANVSRYRHDQNPDYDAFRNRKLLLKKSELNKIQHYLNTQGITLVPLIIGLEGKYAKLKIAVARGKKKYDKRQTIKERDSKRQLNRLIKNY